MSILTLKKEKMLLTVSKKSFFYHYQQCLWQNNGKPVKKNKCEICSQRKRFFKIH